MTQKVMVDLLEKTGWRKVSEEYVQGIGNVIDYDNSDGMHSDKYITVYTDLVFYCRKGKDDIVMDIHYDNISLSYSTGNVIYLLLVKGGSIAIGR